MCVAIAEDFVPFIDTGASRKVYAINDDMVMKVAQYLNMPEINWGTSQCSTEIDLFTKYGDKLPLCKLFIEMSSPERILMERITPLTDLTDGLTRYGYIDTLICRLYEGTVDSEYYNSLNSEMQQFAKNILESGLTQSEISSILFDVAFHNIGIKNNKLLILDYGMVEKKKIGK